MFKRTLIALILLPILLLFHNCGKFRSAVTKGGVLAFGCVNEIKPVFQTSMHDFFRSHKCVECHAEGGAAQGKYFAHSNVDTAFQVFLAFGSDSIKRRVDAGHNYDKKDTAEVMADLNQAKSSWDSALGSLDCGNSSVKTGPKSIPFFNPVPDEDNNYRVFYTEDPVTFEAVVTPPYNMPQKLSWDLSDGVSIEIHVQVAVGPFGHATHYLVNNVNAKSNRSLTFKNLKVFLNNETYAVTSFEAVDKTLLGSGALESVYAGATAVFEKAKTEKYSNADAWSLSVEIIEP